jgi:hypothetical protein
MKTHYIVVVWLLLSPAALAQGGSSHRGAAVPCAKILQMPSTDWIASGKEMTNQNRGPQDFLRAIATYAGCYDARTDRLALSLARAGKGPPTGVRGNFRDFEQALEDFRSKALAAAEPPADELKTAYAALYEKQFRYEFYQSYQNQTVKSPSAPKPQAAAVPSTQAPDDSDPLGKAKNHFGELLGSLPEDKMHELHRAFGEILGRHVVDQSTQLEVYRYAIFLLEPTSAAPFSPPPF